MKRHPNEFLRTWTGRLAGSGILYDDYSENSMPSGSYYSGSPIYTKEYSDYIEELENQPVKTYKLSKEEMNKYLEERGIGCGGKEIT